MTDHPILFSGAMVRALLDGRKTQTRRLATSKPTARIKVGDRLWVRENFALECDVDGDLQPLPFSDGRPVKRWNTDEDGNRWVQPHYAATDPKPVLCDVETGAEIARWRTSIHMPRWASRLTLTVTETRTQPLQWIDDRDARAEGVERVQLAPGNSHFLDGQGGTFAYPQFAYASLWNSLHRAPGSRWEDNPDVIALTFTVERRNIDG